MPDELSGDREPIQIIRDLQRRIEKIEEQLQESLSQNTQQNIRPGSGGLFTLIEKADIIGLTANRNGVASAAFSATRLSNMVDITVEVYSAPETDGFDLRFSYPRFRTGDRIAIYEDADGVFWHVGVFGETCSSL